MSRLVWDSRTYHAGVDRGVLYPPTGPGIPWDGLVSITEKPTLSETSFSYLDGQRIQRAIARPEFEGTIEAYTSPIEFDYLSNPYLGSQRPVFGLSYRVMSATGYQIHLIYNALAVPTEKIYNTYSDEADADTLSWDISTRPEKSERGYRLSHIVIDSNTVWPETLVAIEEALYGNTENVATLPSPDEVLAIFDENARFKITLFPDGTFSAEGSDDEVQPLSDDRFQLDHHKVILHENGTFTASSW